MAVMRSKEFWACVFLRCVLTAARYTLGQVGMINDVIAFPFAR